MIQVSNEIIPSVTLFAGQGKNKINTRSVFVRELINSIPDYYLVYLRHPFKKFCAGWDPHGALNLISFALAAKRYSRYSNAKEEAERIDRLFKSFGLEISVVILPVAAKQYIKPEGSDRYIIEWMNTEKPVYIQNPYPLHVTSRKNRAMLFQSKSLAVEALHAVSKKFRGELHIVPCNVQPLKNNELK